MPIGYSATLLPQLYNSSDALTIDLEMGSWIGKLEFFLVMYCFKCTEKYWFCVHSVNEHSSLVV